MRPVHTCIRTKFTYTRAREHQPIYLPASVGRVHAYHRICTRIPLRGRAKFVYIKIFVLVFFFISLCIHKVHPYGYVARAIHVIACKWQICICIMINYTYRVHNCTKENIFIWKIRKCHVHSAYVCTIFKKKKKEKRREEPDTITVAQKKMKEKN